MPDMTIHARYLDPDGTEYTPQSGRVTFTAAAPLILEAGAQRARVVTGVLDPEGYLCRMGPDGAAGERGVILSAPGAGVEPGAWTWRCQPYVQSHAGPVAHETFDFRAAAGEWQLSGLVPVPAPGSSAMVTQGVGVADVTTEGTQLAFHLEDGREIRVPMPTTEVPVPDPTIAERLAALEARPEPTAPTVQITDHGDGTATIS